MFLAETLSTDVTHSITSELPIINTCIHELKGGGEREARGFFVAL
jgi:hypothetical protein